MIGDRPQRRPLTHQRVRPHAAERFPPLPASAKWPMDRDRWRRFAWIILIAATFHLGLLWCLRDLPLYYTMVSEGKVVPTVHFYTEFFPAVQAQGELLQPAERRYTISTKLVENNAMDLPRPVDSVVSAPELPTAAVGPIAKEPIGQKEGAGKSGLNRPSQISLFNLSAPAQRVVYLLDISGSMWRRIDARTRYEVAREEVRRSIRSLPEHVEFNIIVFADRAEGMAPEPIAATVKGKQQAEDFLSRIPNMAGVTDLVAGFNLAFAMHPDSVFLLTDGVANVPEWQILERLRDLQKQQETATRLYAVGMAPMQNSEGDQLLRKLTRAHGGSFLPYQSWVKNLN